MPDQPAPSSTSISDLLRSITELEDLDSCTIIANIINVYLDAIKRRGGRSELFGDDIHRILGITRVLLAAGDLEQGIAKFVNRPGLRGRPEVVQ